MAQAHTRMHAAWPQFRRHAYTPCRVLCRHISSPQDHKHAGLVQAMMSKAAEKCTQKVPGNIERIAHKHMHGRVCACAGLLTCMQTLRLGRARLLQREQTAGRLSSAPACWGGGAHERHTACPQFNTTAQAEQPCQHPCLSDHAS